MHDFVISALSIHMPAILRWSGAIARQLRSYNIRLDGKSSGSATTDALTLADISLQELIVAALRDCDPIFRYCRIDAEESTGDLARFPQQADLTIGIDPIDGTKRYRDRTDGAYSIMLHLRSQSTVLYSLVYHPEEGQTGWWVQARDDQVSSGPDDLSRPAADVVRSLAPAEPGPIPAVPQIYMTGFLQSEPQAMERVRSVGIDGIPTEARQQTPYQLIASRQLCGALIHSPNVYDFPVTLHLCRILGGDGVWVHNGESVHFHNLWLDEPANMLRLPGIVACSYDANVLSKLVELAKDWNPERYHSGPL